MNAAISEKSTNSLDKSRADVISSGGLDKSRARVIQSYIPNKSGAQIIRSYTLDKSHTQKISSNILDKSRRMFIFAATLVVTLSSIISQVFAQNPDLPGEELTDRRIHDARMRRGEPGAFGSDTAEAARAERSQFERAMDTWHAPPLAMQISGDETIIPFGKGGIFVPRFTEVNIEPDVEIFDAQGARVGSTEPGRAFIAEPGDYLVSLGSGTSRQRIVRRVTVAEGRATPVIPDWSGLVIDVVDEQGMMLRGEYELVRIDRFDPYGRGYGASIELGETVRAWVLEPGIYKILGAGEPYNAQTNFVTVRLMPGELTSFLLIQDPDDNFRIRGGGMVVLTPATQLTSSWRFGANVGANVQLNIETDHEAEADFANTSAFTMGFLFDAWLLYRKRPVEWSTRLRLDEGISVTDNNIESMINTPDRLLASSIFIWRLLNWFGPYARAEFNTRLFPALVRRNEEGGFIFVGRDYFVNESIPEDSSQTFAVEPALSPMLFELGAGVSADFSARTIFELRVRLGFATAFSHYGKRHRVIDNDRVRILRGDDTLSLAESDFSNNSIALFPEPRVDIFETGPQAALGAIVRIGAFASLEGEIKIFAPMLPEQRLNRPDLELNGTLSWRLSRILNLDYTYRQSLKQPTELDIPVHTSSHGIWLRLHYSSR